MFSHYAHILFLLNLQQIGGSCNSVCVPKIPKVLSGFLTPGAMISVQQLFCKVLLWNTAAADTPALTSVGGKANSHTHTLSGSHEKYKTLSMDGIALFKEKRRLKTRGDVRHHCHSSHDHRPPTTKHGYPRRPHTDTSSPETSSSASCT